MLLLDDSEFGFTDDLLSGLPQYTIPDTATGIARANVDYTTYQPTVLTGPTPVGAIAAPASKGFFGSLLDDITGALGAAHISVNASGAGVSVVQTPTAGKVLVNTTQTPNAFLANPLVIIAGVGFLAWLAFGRGK